LQSFHSGLLVVSILASRHLSSNLIVMMASSGIAATQKKSSLAREGSNENRDNLYDLVNKFDKVHIEKRGEPRDPVQVIKHPLQNSWTLWFFKNDKGRNWEENQKPIITVSTVEDFWSLYNNVVVASRLPPGSDYSLFKEGISPDWEDPRNKAGGRWIINMGKGRRAEYLDTSWLEIMLYLVGEQADKHAYQVNGAVVNVRAKGDKLGVWVADASKPDSVVMIGKMIKKMLGSDPLQTIGFTAHNDEKIGPGSSSKKFYL